MHKKIEKHTRPGFTKNKHNFRTNCTNVMKMFMNYFISCFQKMNKKINPLAISDSFTETKEVNASFRLKTNEIYFFKQFLLTSAEILTHLFRF